LKHGIVAILGVFMAVLLALPVMAETEATSTNMHPAAGDSGGIVIDTQTPVLDGGAFSQYDTLFMPGAMAEVNLASSSSWILEQGDYSNAHYLRLKPGASPVFVNCPIVSYDSKQGGIKPQVRYLGLQYKTSGTVEICRIEMWNGYSLVKYIDFNPPLKSTAGWSLQVIDLGGWYWFNRGLTPCLSIRNPSPTYSGEIWIGGYGARYEW